MKALRKWRKAHGYRQVDVAKKIGTSKSMVHMIETGRRNISLGLIGKISALTGLPPEVLRPDIAKIAKQFSNGSGNHKS